MRNTPPPPTRVAYSIDEAAGLLGLSGRTVRRLCWSGELVDSSSSPGILFGYAIVWGEWSEISSPEEGNLLRRYVFGSFARTIREGLPGRKANVMHGKDPRFGAVPLGEIITLAEDSHGLFYEVLLDDTQLNRELARGLRAAMYDGSSITYRVIASVLDRNPGTSPSNRKACPRRRSQRPFCRSSARCVDLNSKARPAGFARPWPGSCPRCWTRPGPSLTSRVLTR